MGTEMVGDGVDQNCDGEELCYADPDGDGFHTDGTVQSTDLSCGEEGLLAANALAGDCAPDDPAIHPGAREVPADGIDSDCDGLELCYLDADLDGVASTVTLATPSFDCGSPHLSPTWGGDCNDADSAVYPGAEEASERDGIDQDCDGTVERAGGCSSVGAAPVWGMVGLVGVMLVGRRRRR